MPPDSAGDGRRSTRLPRKTHEEWIQAGLRVLAREGHLGLTLAKVSTEVGVTSGSLYSKFGSWDRYRRALVAWWAEHRYRDEFLAGLDGTVEARDALATCIEVGMALDPAGRSLRLWASEDRELTALIERGDQETVGVLTTLLEQAGLAPADASLRAWVLFTAFAGLYLVTPPEKVSEDVARLVDWMLRPTD